MSEVTENDLPKHRMVFGSYEDALAMVGFVAPPRRGQIDVSEAMIQMYCGIGEDANPSYWDRDYAQRRWGAIVAPPGMLFTWPMALAWRPDQPERELSLCTTVPLPGDTLINARQESEFFEPIRVGDRLTMHEHVEAVSAPKTSHLGVGHFVTTRARFEREDGVVVAELVNSLFRYLPARGAGQ